MIDEFGKVSEAKGKRPRRPIIEKRLSEHVDGLASAVSTSECLLYQSHLDTAKRILARWQGGESESALKSSLEAERVLLLSESLPGKEAELVGRTFGDLCRTLGIQLKIKFKMSSIPKHHFPFDPVDGLD